MVVEDLAHIIGKQPTIQPISFPLAMRARGITKHYYFSITYSLYRLPAQLLSVLRYTPQWAKLPVFCT